MKTEILIAGGGMGGVAAALSALEAGRRVIMTEPTDWLGGQVSQQGVPPDENPWIETCGASRRYQRYRSGVRDYYRKWFPLNRQAYDDSHLNPGGGWVSRISHLPSISAAVYDAMLLPFEAAGQLTILRHHEPVSADVDGDRVRSVTVKRIGDSEQITIDADFFIDATETGELLPLSGCEYVTGAESQSQHGEPHAPKQANPLNMQAATWCFAVDMAEGNQIIDKPANYDKWRHYQFSVTPAWPGPLFSWTDVHPRTLQPRRQQLELNPGKDVISMWGYRQVLDPSIFDTQVRPQFNHFPATPGITIVNWPQNDYTGGPLFECADGDHHWQQAKEQSLNFFYWLQTQAPRADGGVGFSGLRLRPDVMGTDDGFAKYPYIRESRRIKAKFTVTENHIGADARGGCGQAEQFDDSVGIGYYHLDLHPSTGGDNYIDIASYPFQIPLGSLIPQRVRNLVPACKNIGTTHISNGCYRLHPVEWVIGEAAGALGAMCLTSGESSQAVWESQEKTADLQKSLTEQGAPLKWPAIIKP